MFVEKIKNNKFLFFLLFADVLLIVIHIIWGNAYRSFNLDVEQNIPTLYQGLKLLFAGHVSLLVTYLLVRMKSENRSSLVYFIYATLGLIYLGIDEIGQIHETIGDRIAEFFPELVINVRQMVYDAGYLSSDWLIFMVPIALVASVFVPYTFKYIVSFSLKEKLLLALGALCIVLVIPVEFIGSYNYYEYSTGELSYNISIIIEESLELIGISILSYLQLSLLKQHAEAFLANEARKSREKDTRKKKVLQLT